MFSVSPHNIVIVIVIVIVLTTDSLVIIPLGQLGFVNAQYNLLYTVAWITEVVHLALQLKTYLTLTVLLTI